MSKEQFADQRQMDRSDIVSAILSNLTVVIQIVALGIVGLSNVLQVGSLFQLKEMVNLANFTILFLSFSLIGIYSFFKANRDIGFSQPEKKGVLRQINEKLFGTKIPNPMSRGGEKTFLIFLFILTTISSVTFILTTYKVMTSSLEQLDINNGLFQILSYSLALVCGSVLIFVWIRDQLDKKSQFTEDSFIPNLRSTLIDYEIVETPKLKIAQNFSISNGNHLIKIEVDKKEKYLITNFDGKRVFGEISEEEYNNIINPPQNTNDQQN